MDAVHSVKIDNRPLYLRAIESIKALLAAQVYKPGDVLPPEETLAAELGISRLTLREALGYLENDGFIERRRGVGTFVCEPAPAHFAGGLERLETLRSLALVAGLHTETVARRMSLVPATAAWAAVLAVAPGSELVRVEATQAIAGITMAHFDSLALPDLVDLPALQGCDGSLLEYLLERGKPPLHHSRSAIDAVNADRAVAAILDIAEGQAVLHLSEVFYLADRRPASISDNYILTGAFNFYIARRAARLSR